MPCFSSRIILKYFSVGLERTQLQYKVVNHAMCAADLFNPLTALQNGNEPFQNGRVFLSQISVK